MEKNLHKTRIRRDIRLVGMEGGKLAESSVSPKTVSFFKLVLTFGRNSIKKVFT